MERGRDDGAMQILGKLARQVVKEACGVRGYFKEVSATIELSKKSG